MSNQQQLKECNKCKAAGFPNQMIGFLPDGVYADSGKKRWKLLNPDTSQHEHKKPTVVGTTMTGPIPSINMSESQRKSIDDSPSTTTTAQQQQQQQQQQFDKEEYYRKREEKYDNNIQDYKKWQAAMLKEFENQSGTLENLLLSFQGMGVVIAKYQQWQTDMLTCQRAMAQDIKDMLRILSTQTQEPTMQKASELAYGLRVEGKKSSQAEQEEAFENLDNTIDELAEKIEKEIKQEDDRGYP